MLSNITSELSGPPPPMIGKGSYGGSAAARLQMNDGKAASSLSVVRNPRRWIRAQFVCTRDISSPVHIR